MLAKVLRPASYEANIIKFYLYRALRFAAPWLPIYVIFFQETRGLTLLQIALIDSLSWWTVAFGEIPTGMIADRFGRKTSLLMGTTLYTLVMITISTVTPFPLIVIAYVVWGLAYTLTSGADEALLYETLHRMGREATYKRIAARADIINKLSAALGSLVGGLLATIDLTLPFICGAVLGTLSVLVVMSMKEPERIDQSDPANPAPTLTFKLIMQESVKTMRERPIVTRAILYLAVIPMSYTLISLVYIQPYTVSIGLPLVALGVIIMMFDLVAIGGAMSSERIGHRFGERTILTIIPAVLIGSLLILSQVTSLLGLALIAGLAIMTAIVRPMVMSIIHHRIHDRVRATIMSMQSLLATLFLAVMSPAYGFIADRIGLNAVFFGMAVMVGIYVLFAFYLQSQETRRVRRVRP